MRPERGGDLGTGTLTGPSDPDPGPGGAPLLTIGQLAAPCGQAPVRDPLPGADRAAAPTGPRGRATPLPPTTRCAPWRYDAGQRAGLALDEIKLLLSASPNDGEAIHRLRDMADRKLPQITAPIERSQLLRH